MLALAVLLPLVRVALAQSNTSVSTASAVGIEGIQANFQNAQIVPQLLSAFEPQGLLQVVYGNNAITAGQNLSEADVATYPMVSFTPTANASSSFNSSTKFTIMLVDANVVGTNESNTPQTRHWLVNSATLDMQSEGGWALNFTGSTAITNYNAPGPAPGSGSHRYVVLLYAQPTPFTPPADLSTPDIPLGTFVLRSYVQEGDLGLAIGGQYFQVEEGVATFSVSPTTSVDSSTLPGFGSTTATSMASGMTSASGTQMMTSTASHSSASATTTKTGGASRQQVNLGAVVGGLGVAGAVVGAALSL